MSVPNLHIAGVCKRYADFVALAPTHLDVAPGEFLTLLGPSGSGKTTLLNVIAGMTHPDDGQVLINGVDVTYGAAHERDIGMVFQNYALFPHMTVAENIAFPLQMRKVKPGDIRRRVADALEMVHLPQLAGRYPRELSGGQQQRIALARCMVYRPAIILMDEPLGALDKKLRDRMQLEIKRMHRELGTTIVYVTHDQEEAMTMSDRICLMNQGRIAQLGSPADLYFRPRSVFVADFLGESNLLDARVTACAGTRVSVQGPGDGWRGEAMSYATGVAPGQPVTLMLRPQNLRIDATGPADGRLRARVTDVMVTGSMTKLYLHAEDAAATPLIAAFATGVDAPQYRSGQALELSWQASDAVAIGAETAGAGTSGMASGMASGIARHEAGASASMNAGASADTRASAITIAS